MTLDISADGDVVLLTLKRPPVNALDRPTVQALDQAFRKLADKPPAAVVLTGAGSTFCAGVDTKVIQKYPPAERRAMVLEISRMVASFWSVPCPVVAAVNGHALGGGFVLMLCADWRLAADSDTIKLGMTEAQAGVPFPAGPAAIIAHEMPPPLLRQMTLASQVLLPWDLLEARVVDGLCAPNELMAKAKAAARQLAAQPAFRTVKKQMRGTLAAYLAAIAKSGQDDYLDSF